MTLEKNNTLLWDINNVTLWTIEKSTNFFKNLISNKLDFYENLKQSNITPNNIVSARVVFLVVWGVLYAVWQKELWFLLLVLSAAWDFLDWKVARKNNQKSKNWELYDAWVDKATDIEASVLSTIELISNPLLASVNWWISLVKVYQHYKWQFREGRPNIKDQLKIFYDSFFRDRKTEFIEWKTSWAANKYWKYKTVTQLTSWIWILWNSMVNDNIDIWQTKELLDYIFITLWWLSLVLGHLSNKK